MLALCFILFAVCESNIGCADSACSSCTSGFLYNSISCLPCCPTGYIGSEGECIQADNLSIITLYFASITLYNETGIGEFITPGEIAFSTQIDITPIPTAHQGFYFSSQSSLSSSESLIISPDFSLTLLHKLDAPGILFQVYDGSTLIMKWTISTNFILLDLLLANSETQETLQPIYLQYSFTTQWGIISVHTIQENGQFQVNLSGKTFTLPGYEFRYQSNSLSCTIGDPGGEGIAGFLYFLLMDNQIRTDSTFYYFTSNEIYNHFTYKNQPGSCNAFSCANQWPWCIRSSCSSCYSDNCSACNGYGLQDCIACVNPQYSLPECGLVGLFCLNGGLFSCAECQTGYVLIDGLCLVSPFGYNTQTLNSPVVDVQFDTFQQYYAGIIYSGPNANTYSPVNPDTNDPLAVKSRGLYFTSSRFLLTTISFILNYKFIMTSWIWASADGKFYLNGQLKLYSNSCASLQLSSPADIKWILSGRCVSNPSKWAFNQISVGFSSSTTTITMLINQAVSTAISISGFAFYQDATQKLQIGAFDGTGFEGFLYRFTLWQTDSVDTSREYNVCGNGLAASCLWNCDINYYYNPYLQACANCDASCTEGCATWGTCSQCLQSSCSTCTDFNATCTQDLPLGQCFQSLTFTASGKCCGGNCADCYGSAATNCLECIAGYYLLGDNCLQTCPLGFTVSGNRCSASVNPIIVLSFDFMGSTIVDSASGIAFTSIVAVQVMPAIQRGYYFTGAISSMQSEAISLCYNFTAILYLKVQNFGEIFNYGLSLVYKSLGQINIQGVTSLNSISFSATNQWIVLGFTCWRMANQLLTTQIQYSGYPLPPVTSSTTESASFINGIFYIGSSPASNSFTGFLWNLKVYSSIEDASELSIQTCLTSLNTNCLWPCQFNQYFEGTNCLACSSGCLNSVCRREYDCSPCINLLCTVCKDYYTCTSCVANAELNFQSVCECSAGYYWDILAETCTSCNILCQRCIGPTFNDCYCGDNSSIVDYQCICNEGYVVNNTECVACNYKCLTCSAFSFYDCLSCTDYLLETVCLAKCPVGYIAVKNECNLSNMNEPVLRFVFNAPQTIFTDQIQGLTAISGGKNSTYPYLDSSDPIPAYQRGIYFTGNGSYLTLPYSDNDLLLLGIRFFIAVWINPYSTNGTILFYQDYAYQTLLTLSLTNLYVATIVEVDYGQYNYSSISPLQLKEWNHVLLCLDYNVFSSLQMYINTYESQSLYLTNSPFTDSLNSLMIIGADGSFVDFFNGFIYSLDLYLELPQLSKLVHLTTCNTCVVCPSSDVCIQNCNITAFYNQTTLECVGCKENCENGCRNQDNCTICIDPNCISCSSPEINSCTACMNNYQIENNECSICRSSSYYDPLQQLCADCESPCTACNSATVCTACLANSHLDSNDACQCDFGYTLNNTICSRISFYALITISSTNIAMIAFTEDLKENLNSTGIQVAVNEVVQQFTLEKLDNSSYSLSVTFSSVVVQGDTLFVNFTTLIVSKHNSILATQFLEIGLFPDSSSEEAQSIAEAQGFAQSALKVGIAAVFGSSIINLNPTSLFNFLNNLDIYVYMTLYNQDLDSAYAAFIQMLSPNSWVPNAFSYFINQNDGNQLDSAFQGFGNPTNLIMINSGSTLSILAIFLILPVFALCFKKIKHEWINRSIEKLLANYKYRVFLRFFLQSFIELSCNSAIGIYFTTFANATQIVDFMLCLTIAVLSM